VGATHSHPLGTYSTLIRLIPLEAIDNPSNATNQGEKVPASYRGICPERAVASWDYPSTTRKTSQLPVGYDRLLGAGETIYGQPPFWPLPILPSYILQTRFSGTDGDDVYGVTAAA